MKTVKLITTVTLLALSLAYPANAQNMDHKPDTASHKMLVWYDFEGDFLTSGIIKDRSGNGHTARVIGPVGATKGISGSQAILFSGGYIQAQDNPAAGRTLVTFSLWFKTKNPKENYKLASAAWWNGGPASGWIMATHVPEFWSDDTQSLVPLQPNNENNFPVDQWVHEAVTYDGVRIKEYTNGQLINDWFTTGAAIGQGLPMAVGAWPQYSGYNFQGSIDEFKIFGRALSQKEIQNIYHRGRGDGNRAPFFTSTPVITAMQDNHNSKY